MAFLDGIYFNGELDGKTSRDFNKLDYNLTKLKDRIEHVNNKLECSNFFINYFENHFKVNLNSVDPLSANFNICNILENMGTYILNSDEVKEEDEKNKPVYVFHKSSDKFEKKLKRENISINNSYGEINITDEENIVHSLMKKDKNSRLPKRQRITKSDLDEDTECGRVLREYQDFLDYVNEKLQQKPDKNWRYYSNAKFSIKDDMIMVKDMMKGVWGYNSSPMESSKPDLDIFDFTDIDTIKYMLTMEEPSMSFDYDMWIVWLDFQELLKKVDFTTQEEAVVACLREQWKLTEIADEMKIDYQRLRRTILENIAKKISKLGCKYDAEDPKIDEKIKKKKEKKVEV